LTISDSPLFAIILADERFTAFMDEASAALPHTMQPTAHRSLLEASANPACSSRKQALPVQQQKPLGGLEGCTEALLPTGGMTLGKFESSPRHTPVKREIRGFFG
jgi:hypothetical protein